MRRVDTSMRVQWTNPDGTAGGSYHPDCQIDPSVYLHPGAIVVGRSRILGKVRVEGPSYICAQTLIDGRDRPVEIIGRVQIGSCYVMGGSVVRDTTNLRWDIVTPTQVHHNVLQGVASTYTLISQDRSEDTQRLIPRTNPDGSPGGWVSATARVDPSIRLTPMCFVVGDARITGEVIMRGRCMILTGHAVIDGTQCPLVIHPGASLEMRSSARISGGAAILPGKTYLAGSSRVTDFARLTNVRLGGKDVMRGTTPDMLMTLGDVREYTALAIDLVAEILPQTLDTASATR